MTIFSNFSTVILGIFALLVPFVFSIFYFSIKRFAEKLAELSAADLYAERIKK